MALRNLKTKLHEVAVPRHENIQPASKVKKFFLKPFLFCLIATALLGALFTSYIKNLQTLVDDESYSYLEEIAAQINTSLQDKLGEHYSVLSTFERILIRNSNLGIKTLLEVFEQEKDSYGYEFIALIDSDGNLHTTDGKVLFPDLLPYIADMKQVQSPVTSSVMNFLGVDCAAFMTPVQEITVDGTAIQGIIAAANMDTLTDSLSLSVFDGQGFAHVITPSGSVVMRAVSGNSDFKSYNLLTYLDSNAALEDITIEKLREDLRKGSSGRIRFIQPDGMEMFAFYTPSGYQEWYLFAIIPSNILTVRTSGFFTQTALTLVFLTVIFVALLIIIILSQQQKKHELLNTLHTDGITGGRSMLKFELDVNEALLKGENQFSLLYANVEKFKLINEQLGRINADHLLKELYQAFESELDEKNSEYVSRLMADHFGILLHTQDLQKITERVGLWDTRIQSCALKIHAPAPIRVTYGIFPVNRLEGDVAILLDRANMARKLAVKKAAASSQIACYDESLNKKLLLEQELEARQESALADREFQMYLQPKYDPKTNTIAGAEALVRWHSAEKGMLFPDQYIPLFESNGFIVKLDLFIFEEACRFIENYIHMGGEPFTISVNLSRINLNQPQFMAAFHSIWSKYHFDSRFLEFEITESLIFDNMEMLSDTISEIHKYGFGVSMDDFGSGYSSLNMLKNVSVDVIKLDRQFFVGKAEDEQKGRIIVSTMIKLCKELGIHVVAEGVETEEQVTFLRGENCDLIQGYYYAKPMPQEQFLSKLTNA